MRWIAPLLRPLILAFVGLVTLLPMRWLTRRSYREGRPTSAGRAVNRFWSWLVSNGLTPERWPGQPVIGPATIETRGRRTGERCSNMVTWVEYEGERYLVSMLGERSDWVRNSRAAGGDAVIRHGRRRAVSLVEVPLAERAPIIRAWYQRTVSSTKLHLGLESTADIAEFERVAPAHPVFRIAYRNVAGGGA